MAEHEETYRHRYPLRGSSDPALPLVKVLPPSAAGPNTTLTIPSKWMMPHLVPCGAVQNEKATLLLARQGKYWPVKVLLRQYSCMLSGGWGRFSADNELRPGDELTLAFSHRHNGCTVVRVDVKRNAIQVPPVKPEVQAPHATLPQGNFKQAGSEKAPSVHGSTIHPYRQANPSSPFPVLQGMPTMMVNYAGMNGQHHQAYSRQTMPTINALPSQYLASTFAILEQARSQQLPVQQHQPMPFQHTPHSSVDNTTQVTEHRPTTEAEEPEQDADSDSPKTFVLMGVTQSV